MGLLQRADVAMYEAKRMRTGHEVYLAGRDRHSRQRLALVGELRRARSRPASSSCTTSRRPSCATRRRCAASRRSCAGSTRSAGCSGPAHFLPLVEQSGLTRALTAFVLDRALEEIGRLRRAASTSASPSTSARPTCSTSACPRRSSGCSSEHRFPPDAARDRGLRGRRDGRRRAHASTCSSACARSASRTALDDFGAGHAGARPPQGAARRRAQDRPLVRHARRPTTSATPRSCTR